MIRTALLLGAILIFLPANSLVAQLRPLDPLDWSVFGPGRSLAVEIGAGVFNHQRASLAGTEGRLLELGAFRAIWRTGRVALEVSGTVMRSFEDQEVFAAPAGGAAAPDGSPRHDAGDFRVSTAVRLTPLDAPALLGVRFGTRLPTTDNTIGLERDRTDFFALVAGRVRRGGLSLSAETGVGINGSRHPEFEQVDTWMYAATATYRYAWLTPSVTLTGHWDGLPGWTVRGHEDLREVRLGVRAGTRAWIQATAVRGLTEFSPGYSMLVSAGIAR